MMNGSYVKMNKGKFTRVFFLFIDGDAIEYTKDGPRKVTCPFTTLYNLLKMNGWEEVKQ